MNCELVRFWREVVMHDFKAISRLKDLRKTTKISVRITNMRADIRSPDLTYPKRK
jgi:hypothetical protein